jgi:hypothetical protein
MFERLRQARGSGSGAGSGDRAKIGIVVHANIFLRFKYKGVVVLR